MATTFTKRQKIALGVMTTLFFLSVSTIAIADLLRPQGVSSHFDWPDETSNAYFASRFAETGRFVSPVGEGLDVDVRDLLVPRSFNYLDGALVPAGFLGLPLYYGVAERAFGSLPGISGEDIALFFTPFLAAVALLAFARLVAGAYGGRAGTYAAIALATAPAWWYYSAYPYLPNVPAVAFFVLALAAFAESAKRRAWRADLFALMSGVCLGVAAAVRPNDVFWYALATLVGALVFGLLRGRERALGIALVSAAVAFAPAILFQKLTYGGFLVSGYSRFAGEATLAPTEFAGAASSPVSIAVQALLLPYGLHPRVIWYNLWRSWIALAPWFSVPAVATVAWVAVRRKKVAAEKAWLLSGAVLATWLLTSYGSWMTADPLVLKLNTIGVSHVRYWLPLSLLAAFAIGIAADAISRRGRSSRVGVAVFLSVVALLSARMVFFSEKESLVPVAGRVAAYGAAAETVVGLTPEDAVVVTDRTDKEIFPDRAVTGGFPVNGDGLRALVAIACVRPVYLYASWTDARLADAASAIRESAGRDVGFEKVGEPRAGYGLWELSSLCPTGER